MKGDLNRFNWLAHWYDALARAVFGKAILESQLYFVGSIAHGSQILMIGGGTGAILPILFRTNPTCLIWYVDASSHMINLATEKIPPQWRDRIRFIHGTEKEIPGSIAFDVIITHFLLDVFPEERGFLFCRQIHEKLKTGGQWFISDFVDSGKWWQRVMLWIMYRFFVLTSSIEATSLPPWERQLRDVGMRESACKLFFGGFIKSAVYRKE